jgi:molybdopterin converting factor small subunit
MVRIELYGLARHRAATEAVEVEGATVGAALVRLGAACPGLVPDVIDGDTLAAGYLASINGEQFVTDACHPLVPGDTLLILGAEAGG